MRYEKTKSKARRRSTDYHRSRGVVVPQTDSEYRTRLPTIEMVDPVAIRASIFLRRRAVWKMLSVYIASTTMAPSRTSRNVHQFTLHTFKLMHTILTEIDLRFDDTTVETIRELDRTVNRAD